MDGSLAAIFPMPKTNERKSRLHLAQTTGKKNYILIGCVGLWYIFAAVSTFSNKVIIKQYHVSPELLTLCHLAVTIICDLIVLTIPSSRHSSWSLQQISLQSILYCLPLSLLAVIAKLLTYWSYQAVPVSITHTCKASQPLFNVVMTYVIYQATFSWKTYFSLIPIVMGVSLASVSEMNMNDLAFNGVSFAIISALFGVMGSMYSKYLLRKRIFQDSVNLQFYGAILSLMVNVPFVVYTATTHPDKTLLPSIVPYGTMLLCSLMYFISTFCSSYVLGEVSELTYSVMSTMKRVVIILSAILYFGNPVTTQSILGMTLAVSGVGMYQLLKVREKETKRLNETYLPRVSKYHQSSHIHKS